MSVNKFHPRKPTMLSGGGLMTANPPPAASASTSSTAAPVDEQLAPDKRSARQGSIDSYAIDDDDDFVSHATADSPLKRRALPPSGRKQPVVAAKKRKATKEADFAPAVEWPEHFKKLEKTFKALNTVYTFCSARRSMAITFDMLKGSVENLLKRPLEISDIAQIKSLLPSLISFAYVDAEALRVHALGANEANRKRIEKQRDLDEAFQAASSTSSSSSKGKGKEETVLFFAFNDGELKAANGVGKVISRKFQWNKKKSKETAEEQQKQAKTADGQPRFTTAQMSALIEKRNNKFVAAVGELLVACAAHDPPQDPVELLTEATEDYLPVAPDPSDPSSSSVTGAREKRDELDFYQRNPDKRPSIEKIIQELVDSDDYRDQIVNGGHRIFDAREPRFGELDVPLSDELWDALYATKRINSVYAHQAQAINQLDKGKNVIVCTSTSSGKSLIYQVPAIKAFERDEEATALYVFPTKALAQDQKRALGELVAAHEGLSRIKIATFDGDTPREDRDYIRENANVIFTNPDMLHVTVLPREETWRRFFRNLRFVVVDELHTYAGLFGCHVAYVMRRLRRICAAIGNRHVQFISCSATIANPVEHMQTLFGIEDVELVDEDGSPTGRKEYLVWNPPFLDEHDVKQGRVNTIAETSKIFRFLMAHGIRAIVFCRIRKQCEVMMKQVRADLAVEGRSDMASRVMAYRSGYSAQDRRKIEQDMFSGHLLGIIATTALELGIDIGSLDAVITVGFPYTLPGLRQQAGRAGRRNKDSLAMLICDPFPLDQHYARNPDLIFDSPYNKLAIDLDNPIVIEGHMQCAADEMPIKPEDDEVYFGPRTRQICEERLMDDSEGYFHCHPRYKPHPAKTVSIRSTEDENYAVIDVTNGGSRVIEEVEFSRAIFTIYEGAVFMHQGRTFLTKEMNHDHKYAKVEEATMDWMTKQRDYTNVDAGEVLSIRQVKGSEQPVFYGTVKITSVVFGYFKVDRRNNILDTVDISSPPFERESHGFWVDVPKSALEILLLKNLHPAGSIHAAEHALMSLTPIVAMSVEGDVRTECKQPEKELARSTTTRKRPPRLILYDSSGKSGGVCAKAFDHISLLVTQAADTIKNCRCTEGCPSCVASHVCSGANAIVSKLGALVVLESILGREIDVDAIPVQELPAGITPGHTIDLAAAGIKTGPDGRPRISRQFDVSALMAEDDVDEDTQRAREAALASLFGPGGNSSDLANAGGFVR